MSENLPPLSASKPCHEEQIEDLFRRQSPRLIRFFRRRTGNVEAAQDLAQDVFVRFLRVPRLADIRDPEAYLRRIAGNLLVDRARRQNHATSLSAAAWREIEPSIVCPQHDALAERDLRVRYERALDGLTPRSREVFLLHRVEELSYKAIAARLGVSVGTVEYHMTRALAHLDRMLATDDR